MRRKRKKKKRRKKKKKSKQKEKRRRGKRRRRSRRKRKTTTTTTTTTAAAALPAAGAFHAAIDFFGSNDLNRLQDSLMVQHGRQDVVRRHDHAPRRHVISVKRASSMILCQIKKKRNDETKFRLECKHGFTTLTSSICS